MSYNNYKYNFDIISQNLTDFEKKLQLLEKIRYIEDPKRFYKETAYLKRVDGKLSYYYLFSKIKSNSFNPGSGYLTHGFDFYRGSFHGQMIRGLINYCNLKENSKILDPFCGSGTTLIEANLLGFNAVGIDINPIACLNSKIKTKSLSLPIKSLNNVSFPKSKDESHNLNLEDFNEFLKRNIKDLYQIFIYLRALSMNQRFSTKLKKGFQITFNKMLNTLKKYQKLLTKIDIYHGRSEIIFGDNISYLNQFKSNIFDAIITSPPYMDLIDYIEEDLVQIQYLFNQQQIKNLKSLSIGTRFDTRKKTIDQYWLRIKVFLQLAYKVLIKGRYFILIVGNHTFIKDKFLDYSIKVGFNIERILQRKVFNVKKKDNKEYVLFLKKKS